MDGFLCSRARAGHFSAWSGAPIGPATRTKKLLVLRLKRGDPRFELVPSAHVHFILLLALPEAVDRLADEPLVIGQLPAERHDVLVAQRRHRRVVVDRVQLAEDLAQLLVLLGKRALLLDGRGGQHTRPGEHYC